MRSIVLILCIAFSFIKVNGQDVPTQKNEIRIGYGFLSDIQIAAALANTFTIIFSGMSGDPVSSVYHSTGPLTASYHFFLSKRMSIAPEINFLKLTFTDHYSNGDVFDSKFAFSNLSVRFDYRFLVQDNVQLYSGLALGGTYVSFHSTDPTRNSKSAGLISYQLNLLGIRVGKVWAGYAEFGIGRNGLVNVGISRKL